MTDTTVQAETAETSRTFYRSDYRNAARLIQSLRHVKGNRYQAKPDAQMEKVNGLALLFAGIFEEDALHAGNAGAFDRDKFLAGTQLPQAQSHVVGNVIVGTQPGEFGYQPSEGLTDTHDE